MGGIIIPVAFAVMLNEVTKKFVDSTSGQGAMMAISAVSKNPERALMFLNLLSTDPALMTMMNYGLEGFTYQSNGDGTITFNDENRATYSPWTNGMGNVRMLPPTCEQGAYIFDSSELSNEATAIANVYAQYGFQLMAGATNPDQALPEFLSKLEDAGMSKLVESAQQQLADYLAAG